MARTVLTHLNIELQWLIRLQSDGILARSGSMQNATQLTAENPGDSRLSGLGLQQEGQHRVLTLFIKRTVRV